MCWQQCCGALVLQPASSSQPRMSHLPENLRSCWSRGLGKELRPAALQALQISPRNISQKLFNPTWHHNHLNAWHSTAVGSGNLIRSKLLFHCVSVWKSRIDDCTPEVGQLLYQLSIMLYGYPPINNYDNRALAAYDSSQPDGESLSATVALLGKSHPDDRPPKVSETR